MTLWKRRLAQAAAAKEDEEFLKRLAEMHEGFGSVDLAQRPDPLRMFAGFWILHVDVEVAGIWKFLAQDEGSELPHLIRWSREIGATKTLAYLSAVQDVFPRGKVSSDASKRFAAMEKMEQRASRTGDVDPLRALDERLSADALADAASAVRRWVHEHADELAASLQGLKAPEASPFDAKAANAVLVQLRELEKSATASHEKTVATLRQAATSAKLIPWRGKEEQTRLAAFVATAKTLSEQEWTTVAQRYHAKRKAIDSAVMHCFGLSQQLRSGQLGDKSAYGNRFKRFSELRAPLLEAVNRLPQQAIVGTKKVGVLKGANQAAAAAAVALHLHDWLMLTPDGIATARACYAPFAGLAPTPQT